VGIREHIDSLWVGGREANRSAYSFFRDGWYKVLMKEEKTYPVIRLEVVHLLAKHKAPDILAEKLYDVERVVEARPVTRESGACVSALTPLFFVLIARGNICI
jgi:hypothetical protein